MRRILLLFILLINVFILAACGFFDFDEDPPIDDPLNSYTLVVSSNESSAETHVSPNQAKYVEGTETEVSALALEGYRFSHWVDTDTNARVSDSNPYRFSISKNTHLEAVYYEIDYFTISLNSNISASLNVSGNAPYVSMMLYTITAETKAGYRFEHWIDVATGLIVSYQNTFSFTLNRNREFNAVYTEDSKFSLYMYSNVAVDNFEVSGDYDKQSSVELVAPNMVEHAFVYWFDYRNDTVLSEDKNYTLVMDQSYHIIAVYRYEDVPRTYFEETFEDLSKGTYAPGELQAYGHTWWFEDALVGTLDNDQKTGSRSARIRDGYIELQSNLTNIARIEFSYGKYLADQNGTLEVYLSFDNNEWVLVETLNTTATWNRFVLEFDTDFYETYAVNRTTSVAVRLGSPNASRRTNVDDFIIYRYHFTTPELPQISAVGDDLEFPNNSTRVTISFDEDFVWAFSYGDSWTGEGCLAVDVVLGSLTCQIDGTVNTSRLGEYEVTYYVLDADGNYASEVVTKVVLRDASLLDFDYSGYYSGIEGLYGDALVSVLREILNEGVTLQNYDSAREILAEADVDPNNNSKVLTIYDRQSVERIWDATTWHREHVWPNSRLGIPRVTGSQRNIGSDLHNLRAIIPSVNSSRSNKVFSIDTTTDTYYPGNEDKGDVARILFYMVVMWDHLKLVDDVLVNDPDTNYTLDGAQMSLLSYLIRWHFEDPVDGFEEHRNNVIFSYQNNRNPFIDYPHLVELIWFDSDMIPIE